MNARMKFQKSLLLLDRDDLGRGEQLLKEVVQEAEGEGDAIALVQSLVCLGELLFNLERDVEAEPLLRRALTMRREDDLLAVEFETAQELS